MAALCGAQERTQVLRGPSGRRAIPEIWGWMGTHTHTRVCMRVHTCERKYTHTHLGCINTQRLVFKHEKRARMGFQARNPLSKFISVPSSFGNCAHWAPLTWERPGAWPGGWAVQAGTPSLLPGPRITANGGREEEEGQGGLTSHRCRGHVRDATRGTLSRPGWEATGQTPAPRFWEQSQGDFTDSDQTHDRGGGQFPEGNRCLHGLAGVYSGPGAGPPGAPKATRRRIHRPPEASPSCKSRLRPTHWDLPPDPVSKRHVLGLLPHFSSATRPACVPLSRKPAEPFLLDERCLPRAEGPAGRECSLLLHQDHKPQLLSRAREPPRDSGHCSIMTVDPWRHPDPSPSQDHPLPPLPHHLILSLRPGDAWAFSLQTLANSPRPRRLRASTGRRTSFFTDFKNSRQGSMS